MQLHTVDRGYSTEHISNTDTRATATSIADYPSHSFYTFFVNHGFSSIYALWTSAAEESTNC